ncbi:hypothetical protein OG210_03925 [Streptomyces sp. NBC_00466]|uniref:hypothetical protein n=1 Tax=Streptomyces sp. NBC_00466 TaxID=2903655 RepID=UPI0030E40BBE
MSESIPSTPARKPVRMCVRCHYVTDEPVVVAEVHQNSGPGWNMYACPECAPHLPPVPDVIDLFPSRRGRTGDGAA